MLLLVFKVAKCFLNAFYLARFSDVEMREWVFLVL